MKSNEPALDERDVVPAATGALRVLLLGMMGSGKSTIGTRLAALLGCEHLDNDALLLAQEGKDLMALSREGATVLHDAEARLLRHVCTLEPPFVAGVAGSVAARPQEMRLAHSAGFLVYLRASPSTLAARTAASGERPWLNDNPEQWFERTLASRGPTLEREAHLIIDTDSMAPDVITSEIAAAIRGRTANDDERAS